MDNDTQQKTDSVPQQQTAPVGVSAVPAGNAEGGINGPFPQELNHWNWGAFLLSWIWAIGNRVWIGLLALVLGFIPFVGSILSLILVIALGIKGNEWAWKAKKWDSIEQFKEVQKKWAKWGVIVLIVGVVLTILMFVFFVSMFAKLGIEASSARPDYLY